MAQYCRYCEHAFREHVRPSVYCSMKTKYIDREQAKRTNNCRFFEENKIDALRENPKGYQPTGKKIVQFGGLGKQVTLDELMKE